MDYKIINPEGKTITTEQAIILLLNELNNIRKII